MILDPRENRESSRESRLDSRLLRDSTSHKCLLSELTPLEERRGTKCWLYAIRRRGIAEHLGASLGRLFRLSLMKITGGNPRPWLLTMALMDLLSTKPNTENNDLYDDYLLIQNIKTYFQHSWR